MGRGRGRVATTPVNADLMARAAFAYRKNTDPTGMLRHRGMGATRDVFEDAPKLPGVPLYGYVTTWNFQNVYDVNTTNVWTEVKDNAGASLTVQDERGGIAKFTNDTGDNDHYYYVSKYEVSKLNSSKDLWLTTRIRILDADQADWFVGLCKKVTGADALFDARVDGIGFYGADGSANINAEARKNSTATASSALGTLADDTFTYLGFHVVNTSHVRFFINRSYVGSAVTNLPDDEELAFAFGCRNGQASANAMSIGRTILILDE